MNDVPPLELLGVRRTYRSGAGELAVLRGADGREDLLPAASGVDVAGQ